MEKLKFKFDLSDTATAELLKFVEDTKDGVFSDEKPQSVEDIKMIRLNTSEYQNQVVDERGEMIFFGITN